MRSTRVSIAALLLFASCASQAGELCGNLRSSYGPFDYRKRDEFQSNFELVEGAHFTEGVEAGTRGNTGTVGADLNYTLTVIPNHARALATMGRVGLKEKQVQLPGAKYPVECYFDRAIRFAPDDGAVRATYASYLFALGQTDTALNMFTIAVGLSPDDPTINYNTGLAYLKKKDYAKANQYAQKAYKLGFPLPGLKNKLVEAGKWVPAAE